MHRIELHDTLVLTDITQQIQAPTSAAYVRDYRCAAGLGHARPVDGAERARTLAPLTLPRGANTSGKQRQRQEELLEPRVRPLLHLCAPRQKRYDFSGNCWLLLRWAKKHSSARCIGRLFFSVLSPSRCALPVLICTFGMRSALPSFSLVHARIL